MILLGVLTITPSTCGASILHVGEGQTYQSIQEAIDDAVDGDAVFVHTGYYVENIYIDKPLTLVGENKETTFLNNSGQSHNINISSNYVTIFNFTINNDLECIPSNYEYNNSFRNVFGQGNFITIHDLDCYNVGVSKRSAGGILIGNTNSEKQGEFPFNNYTKIYNNYIQYGEFGIGVANGWYGEIFNNTINIPQTESITLILCARNGTKMYGNTVINSAMGIVMSINNTNNEIYGNTVSSSLATLFLLQNNYGTFANNMIYQNSFLATGFFGIMLGLNPDYDVYDNFVFNNNFSGGYISIRDIYSFSSGIQFWYCYPTGGNYWAGYSGTDNNKGTGQDILGSDGVGDSSYTITGIWNDNYPRMEPERNKSKLGYGGTVIIM